MLEAALFVLVADLAVAGLYYIVPGPVVDGYVCDRDGMVLSYTLNGTASAFPARSNMSDVAMADRTTSLRHCHARLVCAGPAWPTAICFHL